MSIGITVAMLLMTSLVFKSSTDASGRAMARGEIMHQLRSITRQLDQDFKGLRSDMPLAIIFEGHSENTSPNLGLGDPDDFDRVIRYDRLWFFGNGDYQANDYLGSNIFGNVAHIFYGHSLDVIDPPTDEGSLLSRRILTRREKFLTADTGIGWLSGYTSPSGSGEDLRLDVMPVDNFVGSGMLNAWKNQLFTNYETVLFQNNSSVTYSVIRRPQMLDDASGSLGLRFFSEPGVAEGEGFQRLYVAGDVTDFKVEVWFAGATEWFPNATDIDLIQNSALDFNNDDYFGFYWNAAEDISANGPPRYEFDNGIEWRGETGVNELATLLGWSGVWPEALRFSFTLYDKNRRHFPDGETFSYIVKMAKR